MLSTLSINWLIKQIHDAFLNLWTAFLGYIALATAIYTHVVPAANRRRRRPSLPCRPSLAGVSGDNGAIILFRELGVIFTI